MSKNLIFIPTIYHFDLFQKSKPDWSCLNVFTDNFNVGSIAMEYTDVFYLTSYMAEAEINAHLEQTLDIQRVWVQSLQGRVIHRGISLPELTVPDHYNAILTYLNLNCALPRLLDELQPERLLIFQEFDKPDFMGLPHTHYPDGMHGVIAHQAQLRNLPLSILPGLAFTDDHSSLILSIIQENTHHFPQQVCSNGLESLPQVALFAEKKFKRCIFLIGYYMEMFDQDLLFKHLQSDPDTLFVFLSMQNTPLLQWGPSFLSLDFRIFKYWPFDLNSIYQTIDAESRQFFQHSGLLQEKYPDIFKNHFLDFQFQFFFNSLKNNARTIEAMHLCNDSFQPDLILAGGSSSLGGVRAGVETFNHLNIPTLGVMHGGLWFDYHLKRFAYPVKFFAVRGEKYIDKIAKITPHEIEVTSVGDLREHMQEQQVSSQTSQAIDSLFPSEDNRSTVLLVTSSFMVGFSEIVSDPSKNLKTWDALIKLAESRQDLRFLLKPHPGYDFFQFYDRICSPNSKIELLDKLIPVTEILKKVDSVVCVNIFSSTMLEAAHMGKPFVYLRDACYKNSPLHMEEIVEVPDFLVEEVENLEGVLDRIHGDPIFHKKLINAGNEILMGFTSFTGNNALTKALDLISDLISKHPVLHSESQHPLGIFIFAVAQAYQHWQRTSDRSALDALTSHIPWDKLKETEKQALQNYFNILAQLIQFA